LMIQWCRSSNSQSVSVDRGWWFAVGAGESDPVPVRVGPGTGDDGFEVEQGAMVSGEGSSTPCACPRVWLGGYAQGTSYLTQVPQVGRISSHLTCFCLHRTQPWRDLVCGRRRACTGMVASETKYGVRGTRYWLS
jgi:hypothetical protein